MAFVHGLEATLSIDATPTPIQIEVYMTNMGAEFMRALAELRLLGASSVSRLPGLRDFTLTGAGAFDAVVDEALHDMYDDDAPAEIIFSPDGGTTTYTVDCFIPRRGITSSAEDASRWSVEMAASGDCVRTP